MSGILFFAAIDIMRRGASLHIEIQPVAGMVISAIIVLAGLHTTESRHAKTWFGTLLLVYLAGILYLGLKPEARFLDIHRGFLIASTPPIRDFAINILGFVPFAYLHAAYLLSGKRSGRTAMAPLIVLASGIGISLLLELSQYYIPGRTSSLVDLLANSAGTLLGMLYFLLANHQPTTEKTQPTQ